MFVYRDLGSDSGCGCVHHAGQYLRVRVMPPARAITRASTNIIIVKCIELPYCLLENIETKPEDSETEDSQRIASGKTSQLFKVGKQPPT